MLKPGAVLDLGPLNTKFFVKKTAAETNGAALEMEWELGLQTGGTPVHTHPEAIETYEVLDGTLDVFLDGTWTSLSAGEKVVVEAGEAHTFRNSSDQITRVYNSHQPAMKFDGYFESLLGLVDRGVIKSDKMTPKALLHLAALMTKYKAEIHPIRPPALVMRALAFVARRLGYVV